MSKHKPSSSSQSGEPKSKEARIKSSWSDGDEEGEREEVFNQSQNLDFTVPFKARDAKCGIIETLSVKNFMCHRQLECNFGPNVNFVVGSNGSGKSAILIAIVVGLGGNSVKDFIKRGTDAAEVCIKLRNRGDDAYKPDVYGQSITVMRRICRDGGTSYRLMSAKGKVISTKREELSHIMDHFNIQVDNSVSIMDEENSYLLSESAKDRYKFFVKAADLEQLSNDYREIMVHKEMIEEIVNAQSVKPDLEREVMELEQKFKALTCLHDLTNTSQELINLSAWAQDEKIEKNVLAGAAIAAQISGQHQKHCEEKKQELMAKIAKFKAEADETQKKVEEVIASHTDNNTFADLKQIYEGSMKEHNKEGDPEVITREDYETVRKQIRGMKRFVEEMNTILDKKYEALKVMTYSLARKTKYYFFSRMSSCGCVGWLKFDHPKEELLISLDPGENQITKDVRSVSGRERFSKVCLLMALWEEVYSPFRAMDEFVISMDMMYRKVCIELILQFARERTNRQFIFITPCDISNIIPTEFVHITRLCDHERNQGYSRTLGHSR